MAEIDVQQTRQGMLYLMHDDTTDRMTNRTGNTVDVTDDEFKTLLLRNNSGGEQSLLTETPVPTLRTALNAARGRIHLNIDTKHRRDLDAVGRLVVEMNMQDQVLIKMVIDPIDPDLTILDANWFEHLTFMPVMLDPRPGQMARDAVTVAGLFNAKIVEASFLSLGELTETTEYLRDSGVRLWCNTLNDVHPLSFSDQRALDDPNEVWGTLMRCGIGAIQTDQTVSLSRFIGRN